MRDPQQPLEELQHIKRMMERSSRFISLSGLSGFAAGICALAGAWIANNKIQCWVKGDSLKRKQHWLLAKPAALYNSFQPGKCNSRRCNDKAQ